MVDMEIYAYLHIKPQTPIWNDHSKYHSTQAIAAVSCIADAYWLGGVGLGPGTTGKLARAWVGAWMVHGCMVVGEFIIGERES